VVHLGPLSHMEFDGQGVSESLTDSLANWDLVACTPDCARPWRRRRWLAPRVWTCPGCRTRWTVEGRTWVQAMSPTQLARLERELGITRDSDEGSA